MNSKAKKASSPAPKRVFKGDHEITSDLFKLEVATFLRNVSFNPKKPISEPVEHCHFYHTFDSSGRNLIKCNSVGGHYHEVKVRVDEDGNLVGETSAPLRNSLSEPLFPSDQHTHKVKYIRSEEFKPRKQNEQAMAQYSQFISGFSKES